MKIHKGKLVVGDIEIETAVSVPTRECDRLHTIAPQSQVIGEFLDWLQCERGLTLCDNDKHDRYYPARVSITDLLAEYFDIDESKVEDERRAILEAIRR